MILLDTNMLIYLRNGRLSPSVLEVMRSSTLDTCNIIVAEVLGYKFANSEDAQYFENLFATMKNRLFDKEVTNKVIELRQTTSIKLPVNQLLSTSVLHYYPNLECN